MRKRDGTVNYGDVIYVDLDTWMLRTKSRVETLCGVDQRGYVSWGIYGGSCTEIDDYEIRPTMWVKR